MSTKTNTYGKTTTINKNSGNFQQTSKAHDIRHKRITPDPSKELVFLGPCDTVEVTIKREENTKGQKHTSPVASLISGQKAEKKKPTTSNNEVPRSSWSDILGEQTLLHIRTQLSKYGENKETEKNSNAKRQQKSGHCRKGGEKNLKTPCSSCSESILVQDCAVQCPEYSNKVDRFAEFNPAHTLGFLMKELKDLDDKKDKRTCEIFSQMEQILSRIPESFEKRLFDNLEKKLESNENRLKEEKAEMKKKCELWMREREELRSLIQKKNAELHTANHKQADLTAHIKMLTERLEEATHAEKVKDESISALQQQIKNDERIISDLKMELAKQTQSAQENYFDKQYLTVDKNRLSKLCVYKDDLITKYKDTIKELLQNQFTCQFKTLNEAYMNEGSASSQISVIQPGLACSSPTSSSSDRFNKSWHDLSDVSSVESNVPQDVVLKEDAPVKDSAHLELYSLLDGESSHTILLDQNQVTNDKTLVQNNNKDNTAFHQNMNENDIIAKKSLHQPSKKDHNKENDIHKMRKFQGLKERKNDSAKSLFPHNASKIPENIISTKSIVSDVGKQDDMQNRIPVNVPSPLRDYPHPDWSDSSLPSVSTASDLDMIPSNDI